MGGDKEKNIFYVCPDPAVQSEQSARRYRPLAFDPPGARAAGQTTLLVERGHLSCGEKLRMRIVTVASRDEEDRMHVAVTTGEGEEALNASYLIRPAAAGQQEVLLDTANLRPGDFRMKWFCQHTGERGELGLTVLPKMSVVESRKRLQSVQKYLRPGSSATLEFHLEQLSARLRDVKPYETCGRLRLEAESFLNFLGEASRHSDPFATRTGIFRRAFRSRLDASLQPYSVRIPAGFNPSQRYPLLVYLHGSGNDDRGMLENLGLPDTFLAMAPRARGTSHVYVQDHAQEDIQEATQDMIANYPVDPDRIVLAGFSMGGYGVLRTFYVSPSRFSSLAIFSGHPSLPARWGLEGQHPDFLEERYLNPFRGKSLFVSHGRRDQNLPFEAAERMVRSLEAAGAVVRFLPDSTGHEISAQTRKAFLEWLEQYSRPSLEK